VGRLGRVVAAADGGQDEADEAGEGVGDAGAAVGEGLSAGTVEVEGADDPTGGGKTDGQ
jgi:hypothetical protein